MKRYLLFALVLSACKADVQIQDLRSENEKVEEEETIDENSEEVHIEESIVFDSIKAETSSRFSYQLVEGEHGWRNSADLRLQYHSVPGHARQLVRTGRGYALAAGYFRDPVARTAAVRHVLRLGDPFLLLLLYRAGVQLQGYRGEPEEIGRLYSGYSPG